jgi:arginyl-tRNA synthetase
VARNSGISQEKLKEHAQTNGIELTDPKEWKLAKFILKFPEIVVKVLNDLMLHSICDYMYELASIFTEFYDTCYCIQKDPKTGKQGRVYSLLLKI